MVSYRKQVFCNLEEQNFVDAVGGQIQFREFTVRA